MPRLRGHSWPSRSFCVHQNMGECQQSEMFRPSIDNLIDTNPFFGFVHSLERALDIVKEYEIKTTTKFTVYKRSKNFGRVGKCNMEIEFPAYIRRLINSTRRPIFKI